MTLRNRFVILRDNLLYKNNMSDVYLISLPYTTVLPRLTAAEGLFLFGIKKKQKMPAENFSLEVSGVAGSAEFEKFVRPD